MSEQSVNYWKFATIGIVLVGATVAATLLVTGRDSKTEPSNSTITPADSDSIAKVKEKPVPAPKEVEAPPAERKRSARVAQPNRNASGAIPPPPPYAPQASHPPQSVMAACNQYALKEVNSKTEEVLKSATLGAVIGAAVGAAGGAIAGGGSGAGKGAAIGGVTGAAGGSLYGLNETKSHDAQYQAAYASCIRSKGY